MPGIYGIFLYEPIHPYMLIMLFSVVQPKILNNLSIPSLNYFKIRYFVHV